MKFMTGSRTYAGSAAGGRHDSQQTERKSYGGRWSWVVQGFGAVGVGSVLLYVAAHHTTPKPEFVLDGSITQGDTAVNVAGAVNLHCVERGVLPAVVTGSVRLVTDRPGHHEPPRGRIVEARVTPGENDCASALDDVRRDPSAIGRAVVSNIQGMGAEIFGQGHYPTGRDYAEVIDRAEAEGTPVFPIAG